jgi:hypothetical protein
MSQVAGKGLVGVCVSLILCAFAVGGCASTTAIMRHPDGRQAECPIHFGISKAVEMQRGCIDDYRRQGYERQP